MKKDFQKWHTQKEKLNEKENRLFFHVREIWYCSLGANVGFETDGKGEDFLRPVVIVRKFNNEIFWAIPLTKSNKSISEKSEKYYFSFSFVPEINSLAVLSQLRLVDASRLTRHVGEIREAEFKELTKKLKALLP
ncbi:MAG: type II toxin-antitoxin system PemK/MazF family toxin [Candidatus Paceibacterota bacterium]|jgi:mRNA-degrading endonuclease toxin of MazEF toxin-antitoxin module|nr:type II toxin-antitoxin system PemK/MazF family toxin [Candidatus Paceibacterota bacterium]